MNSATIWTAAPTCPEHKHEPLNYKSRKLAIAHAQAHANNSGHAVNILRNGKMYRSIDPKN